MEGSQEALRELSEHYEIFIASAAMDVPSSFDAKYKWLQQHFSFIPPSHYVFCGDKSILLADYLIDDRPRHFDHFVGTGILFTAPHNARRDAPLRADNWRDVTRILMAALSDRTGNRADCTALAAPLPFRGVRRLAAAFYDEMSRRHSEIQREPRNDTDRGNTHLVFRRLRSDAGRKRRRQAAALHG